MRGFGFRQALGGGFYLFYIVEGQTFEEAQGYLENLVKQGKIFEPDCPDGPITSVVLVGGDETMVLHAPDMGVTMATLIEPMIDNLGQPVDLELDPNEGEDRD